MHPELCSLTPLLGYELSRGQLFWGRVVSGRVDVVPSNKYKRYLVFGTAAAELQDGRVVLRHVEEQGTVLDRPIKNENLRNNEIKVKRPKSRKFVRVNTELEGC